MDAAPTTLRDRAVLFLEQALQRLRAIPVRARVVLGLFLLAALLFAIHTAVTSKNSSLRLKVQHGFRSADISVWVDGDFAYSGKLTGSTRKKFGLIPDSVGGSLTELIPVASGRHQVRVRVEEYGSAQEDSTTGDFVRNGSQSLLVSARPSGMALSWQGSTNAGQDAPPTPNWLERYAGSIILSIAGSIISALTGFAIREAPGYLRARKAASQASSPSLPS